MPKRPASLVRIRNRVKQQPVKLRGRLNSSYVNLTFLLCFFTSSTGRVLQFSYFKQLFDYTNTAFQGLNRSTLLNFSNFLVSLYRHTISVLFSRGDLLSQIHLSQENDIQNDLSVFFIVVSKRIVSRVLYGATRCFNI